MEIKEILEAFVALGFGWQWLVIASVILGAVYLAKRANLVVTGNQARIANLALGAVLAGLSENPASEGALLAVLSSVLSALAFEGIKEIGKRKEAKE